MMKMSPLTCGKIMARGDSDVARAVEAAESLSVIPQEAGGREYFAAVVQLGYLRALPKEELTAKEERLLSELGDVPAVDVLIVHVRW